MKIVHTRHKKKLLSTQTARLMNWIVSHRHRVCNNPESGLIGGSAQRKGLKLMAPFPPRGDLEHAEKMVVRSYRGLQIASDWLLLKFPF